MVGAPDHKHPLTFAQRLFDSVDLHHITDRPPLQAGMVLVPYPLWRVLESLSGQPLVTSSCYQVFSVLLQCSWVAAVYALLRGLGLATSRIGIVCMALIPSHFFFIHSVFVWPKLLAGSLAIGTFCLLLFREPGSPKPPTQRVAAAAALAALAFLAHGAVTTALLGFGLVLVWPRTFPGWRSTLIAAAIVGMLLAPWAAVVRWVAPPGNYIAKFHLAGVEKADDRGTFEAVRDTHARVPLRRLAERKWRKARYIVGLDDPDRSFADLETAFHSIRRSQYLQLAPSLDALNLGWLIVPIGLLLGSRGSRREFRALARLLAIAGLCIAVWIAVFFSAPIIQHASYATMILLFASLAAAIATLPLAVALPILLAHVAIAPAAILGFSPTRQYAPLSLAVAAIVYLGLIGSWVWFSRRFPVLSDPRAESSTPTPAREPGSEA